jgi:hypothetical protein
MGFNWSGKKADLNFQPSTLTLPQKSGFDQPSKSFMRNLVAHWSSLKKYLVFSAHGFGSDLFDPKSQSIRKSKLLRRFWNLKLKVRAKTV